jgi:hypothetical protein
VDREFEDVVEVAKASVRARRVLGLLLRLAVVVEGHDVVVARGLGGVLLLGARTLARGLDDLAEIGEEGARVVVPEPGDTVEEGDLETLALVDRTGVEDDTQCPAVSGALGGRGQRRSSRVG